MKRIIFFVLLLNIMPRASFSQEKMEIININDFGAKPNDNINDNEAFEKAAAYINKKGGNIRLIIPEGKYIVGRQDFLKNQSYYISGISTLNICNVNNVEIIGRNATLVFDVGFRFGTFDVKTGLSNNSAWDCKGKVAPRHSSTRATLGNVIYLVDCYNILIKGLTLDGSFQPNKLNNMNSFDVRCVTNKNPTFQKDKINLGGSYGGCGINLGHYGMIVLHSGNVIIEDCNMRYFGTDGIKVDNLESDYKQQNVTIRNCNIDYNARTGIALTGGNNILIEGCKITNTGQCVSFSTGTAIDIEAQADNKYKSKRVTNVTIKNNYMANNISGEILTKYGMGSSNVKIINNELISSSRALNLNSTKNKNYEIKDNIIGGNQVIEIDNNKMNHKSDPNFINKKINQISIKGNSFKK